MIIIPVLMVLALIGISLFLFSTVTKLKAALEHSEFWREHYKARYQTAMERREIREDEIKHLTRQLHNVKHWCDTCEGRGFGFGHDSRGMETSEANCPDCNAKGYL